MQTLLQRGLLLACLIVPAAARSDDAAQIKIDNFTFGPTKLVVAKGTAVTWTNQDDIPHSIVLTGAWRPVKGTRYRQDFHLSVR